MELIPEAIILFTSILCSYIDWSTPTLAAPFAPTPPRTSVIPLSFWYFSFAGGLILLIYAIHRQDPVFILAYLPGNFIYFRNLYLIRKKQHRAQLPGISREKPQLTA